MCTARDDSVSLSFCFVWEGTFRNTYEAVLESRHHPPIRWLSSPLPFDQLQPSKADMFPCALIFSGCLGFGRKSLGTRGLTTGSPARIVYGWTRKEKPHEQLNSFISNDTYHSTLESNCRSMGKKLLSDSDKPRWSLPLAKTLVVSFWISIVLGIYLACFGFAIPGLAQERHNLHVRLSQRFSTSTLIFAAHSFSLDVTVLVFSSRRKYVMQWFLESTACCKLTAVTKPSCQNLDTVSFRGSCMSTGLSLDLHSTSQQRFDTFRKKGKDQITIYVVCGLFDYVSSTTFEYANILINTMTLSGSPFTWAPCFQSLKNSGNSPASSLFSITQRPSQER